jgi:Fe-S oxidoreductase
LPVINALPGIELNEMAKSGNNALCCGVSNWMNCTVYSKQIQVERLQQAKDSGANTLLTACPKCEIHLLCAMKDPHFSDELTIELKDIATLTAESITAE